MYDTTNVNRPTVGANSFFQKSKKQRTIAWILLGGGVAIATVSHNLAQKATIFSDEFAIYGVMFVVGGVATVTSIPFFIASGKNKRKANLVLKGETGHIILYKLNYSALALTVKL